MIHFSDFFTFNNTLNNTLLPLLNKRTVAQAEELENFPRFAKTDKSQAAKDPRRVLDSTVFPRPACEMHAETRNRKHKNPDFDA